MCDKPHPEYWMRGFYIDISVICDIIYTNQRVQELKMKKKFWKSRSFRHNLAFTIGFTVIALILTIGGLSLIHQLIMWTHENKGSHMW